MNLNFSAVRHTIVKQLGRPNAVPDTAMMHPFREWNIGIITATLLCGGAALGAWISYSYYGTISLDTQTTTTEVFNYKRSDALAALEMFSARKAAHQTLIGQAPKPEPVIEEVPEEVPVEKLIEAGLIGTDGQILPQVSETEIPPTLDIQE